MVARVRTVAFQGIDVLGVDAEVQIAQGLPAFNIVGPIATLVTNVLLPAPFKQLEELESGRAGHLAYDFCLGGAGACL
jgi:hypothetical protein